jgi:SAM-dependent methyltransferase
MLGGSAVVLQARLRDVGTPLVVVERNPVLWRMTVRHFGLARTADGVRVETGDPMDVRLEGRFGTVVVDGAGVAPGDAVPLPSASLLRRIRRVLRPDGRLVLGGDDPDVLRGEEAGRAIRERLAGEGFTDVAVFVAVEESGPGRVLLVAGGPGASLPGELEDMRRIELPEASSGEGRP